MRIATSIICFLALASGASTAARPPAAQQQSRAAPTPAQLKEYEAFRFWLTKLPAEVPRSDFEAILQRYASELRAQGKSEAEARAILVSLRANANAAEIERWNTILTAPKPTFNTEPNAFLAQMVRTLKPGRALDVGMGQGRNTIYLAEQGWDAVGFDPADRAVAAARDQAARRGVKITAHVATAEEFAWGEGQWDLIVLSYVGGREYAQLVFAALRSGGMVIVEGFHRDATKTASIGGGVVFDTNELLQLFSSLRVVRYEDTVGVGDFGRANTRVVRLAAVKP